MILTLHIYNRDLEFDLPKFQPQTPIVPLFKVSDFASQVTAAPRIGC